MDTVFPFGFPGPTALYLALFVLTWVVHALFMQYCLAGAVVLVWRLPQRQTGPAAEVVRDWMPAALSGAITAGVAPLLFVQVLYKLQFYTANLLLLHRWMSILGVLIAGFYLYYVLKTERLRSAAPHWRLCVALAALACLAFTGYAWVENHALSLQSQDTWSQHYADGRMWHNEPGLLPRSGVWLFSAWATWAMGVGWQLRGRGDVNTTCVVRLAVISISGLVMAAASGALFARTLGEAGAVMTSRAVLPYVVGAIVGVALQIGAWIMMARQGRFSGRLLAAGSSGVVLTLLGLAVLREALRVTRIDISGLYDQHAAAAAVGGWLVFAAFVAINAVLIAWCLQIVRRHARPG